MYLLKTSQFSMFLKSKLIQSQNSTKLNITWKFNNYHFLPS